MNSRIIGKRCVTISIIGLVLDFGSMILLSNSKHRSSWIVCKESTFVAQAISHFVFVRVVS